MYVAVMMMAMSAPADVGQCSARSSCASTQRVLVVRAACSTSAAAACSRSVAVRASCARVGILQRHHENVAARHQRIADRYDTRALNMGLRRGNVVIVETAPAKVPPKK